MEFWCWFGWTEKDREKGAVWFGWKERQIEKGILVLVLRTGKETKRTRERMAL